MAGTLSSFERSVAIWLVSGDHLVHQQLAEIKIKSYHQTDLAGTLSSFDCSVAIRLVYVDHLEHQQVTEIKIKSNHQTDLADTLSSFERSLAILDSTLRLPREIRRRTWRGNEIYYNFGLELSLRWI